MGEEKTNTCVGNLALLDTGSIRHIETQPSGITGIEFPPEAPFLRWWERLPQGAQPLHIQPSPRLRHMAKPALLQTLQDRSILPRRWGIGVRLEQLVWIRANANLEHALKAADLLIHGGGFGLVVLDLCGIAERRFDRVPLSYWHRCRRAVENTPAILLVLGDAAHVKGCASMSIEMEQEETRWSGNLLEEVRYRAAPRKPVHRAPFVFPARAVV